MTQTNNPIDLSRVRAEVNADVASRLLMEAYEKTGQSRKSLVDAAKLHVAALQEWVTPEAPPEAHQALQELTSLLEQFAETESNCDA